MKEVREETGIECEVERLVAVCTTVSDWGSAWSRSTRWCSTAAPPGAPCEPHPLECDDVGWFSRDALPEPLAPGAHMGERSWLDLAFAAIDGEASEVAFDPPRDEPWRTPTDTDE